MSALLATTEQSSNAVTAQKTGDAGQFLTFSLASEMYAIGIMNIKEIIDYGGVTEVPMMPAFVQGVINLRGSVVPVIDLAARFGKDATNIVKRTAVVIAETGDESESSIRQYIGIIVDAVNGVVDIPQQEIEPAPSFGSGIRPDFIAGMAKRNDRFVILLNVNRVLSVDEMADLSRTALDTN